MRTTFAILSGLFIAFLVAFISRGGPSNLFSSAEAASLSYHPQGVALALQSTNTPTRTRTPTITPTPSPTLRLPFNPGFPGNSSVNTSVEGTELLISARMDNLDVENSGNGAGIHHVDMYIFDQFGRLIDSHRENTYQYCYFPSTGTGCDWWDFAQEGYRWPQGSTASESLYFARALGWNTEQNKVRIAEEAFWLDLSGTGQHAFLGINVGPETEGELNEYVNALEFQTEILFNPGAPITRVSMFIFAPDGSLVYQKDETSEPYCAFGNAEGSSQCNLWDFRANNDRWPGGEPIQRTTYIFRALAYSGNALVGATSRADPVRPLGLLPNPPQPNPSQPNPPLGNFAILANGAQDISQVTGALVFRTLAGDNGVDGNNIDRVEMAVYDEFGTRVHSRSEASPYYCAFGGNEACNPLTFAWEGYRWSNGSAMQNNGTYTLRAVIYFRDGRSPLTISRNVVIRF